MSACLGKRKGAVVPLVELDAAVVAAQPFDDQVRNLHTLVKDSVR